MRYPLTDISRLARWAFIIGVGALAIGAIGGWFEPAQFFQSYLFAFIFWLGVSLGSMAVVMIHHLSNGRWGFLVRRPLEASFRVLPLLALLFVPLLFGLNDLYVWSIPGIVAERPQLQHQSWYLNTSFFVMRAVIYFAIWLALAFWLARWSAMQDQRAYPSLTARLQRLSAAGLLLYVLTLLFSSTDWIMSIEPRWISTVFPLLVGIGQILAAVAFGMVCATVLADKTALKQVAGSKAFIDLGNLLLAFVLAWTYLAFVQYLIVWAENLPREILWYTPRLRTSWTWLALFLVAFHFAVPTFLLLFRRSKRAARTLGSIAAALLLVHVADTYWLITPLFNPSGLYVSWMDFVSFVGIGGLWFAVFLRNLDSRPLLPFYAPGLMEAAENA